MQKHPMLSVKEAAEALKIDERSVRDRLANGTLKGEKKMVGLREKWFIYASALNSALAKQDDFGGAVTYSNPVSVKEVPADTVDATSRLVEEREDDTIVEPEPAGATYGAMDTSAPQPFQQTPPAGDWRAASQINLQSVADAFMKPLLDQLAVQEKALLAKQAVIEAQEKEIEEQKVQLFLLPDLKAKAESDAETAKAAELKMLEAAALQKQAEMLAERAARELAEKEAQMAELEVQVASVEEENKVLEAKANEALTLAQSVQALESKVSELQKPLWKKLLGR